MLISNIIFIVSLLLDGILTNFIPYMNYDLSLFTPMFTIVSLILIYPLLKKEKNKYLIYCFIAGIIYDLLYTNLLFLDGLVFLLLGLIIMKSDQLFGNGYIKILINIILIISIYETLIVLILLIFNLVPVTIDKLLYKIGHSLLLNLVYGEIVYIILNLIPKKYLKIHLN